MERMNSGTKSRTEKAKLNMAFSLIQQAITLICGIIIPKLLIGAFGSEAYGATTSIANFLSYITLLEGGMGAVTRSALYKAFAQKSDDQVSAIVTETQRFYRIIGLAFGVYVLVIAVFFQQISHNTVFSYWYSFSLVIVIALATFAEYFIGISYSLLLQADQAQYIVVIFRIVTTILNAVGIVVLLLLKCDLLIVKLLSSVVFVIRPVLLSMYVKRKYHLRKFRYKEKLLVNKSSALGQHIAWTLHNNTDITVLTVFKELSLVSVYSVYYMVVGQIQNTLNAFLAGMESVFGSMYANHEDEKLQKTFGYYETLISVISVSLYSITAILIVPFIRLYTSGVIDANYIQPSFSIMLICASLLYSMRTPYGHMIIAAGKFKETRLAAYGEAIVNIVISVILVIRYGLIGVAIGTVAATMFRFVYYVIYLSKYVLYRKAYLWLKRIVINCITFFAIYLFGNMIISKTVIDDYFKWIIFALIVTIAAGGITLIINLMFYKEDVKAIVSKGLCGVINKVKGGRKK